MATGSPEVIIPESVCLSAISKRRHLTGQYKLSRIEGYDVARAIAVIGMIMVNYNVIFTGIDAYPDWYNEITDFLYGRAAALFIMLAGVGMTLMGRRALLLSNRSENKKVRITLFKRSLLLFFMGLFFMEWWSADILHFYVIFLTTGFFVLNASGSRLWGLVLSIWLLSTILYCFTDGEPGIQGLIIAPGFLFRSIDDLLFSGYYSAFPWLVFLLIGIWLGKQEIMSSESSQQKILKWALATFVGTELLTRYAPLILFEIMAFPDEGLLDQLILSDVFPTTPLFTISAASSSIIVIIFALTITRYRLLPALTASLAHTGKLPLTIYIAHIFIGLGFERLVSSQTSSELYQIIIVLFTFGFCLTIIFSSHIWFKFFEMGPLEWFLRRFSNSM